MQTWYYVVVSIDGDYANLRRTDIESNGIFSARNDTASISFISKG